MEPDSDEKKPQRRVENCLYRGWAQLSSMAVGHSSESPKKKLEGHLIESCFDPNTRKLLAAACRLLRGCVHVRLYFAIEFTFPAASPLSSHSVILRWCSLVVLIQPSNFSAFRATPRGSVNIKSGVELANSSSNSSSPGSVVWWEVNSTPVNQPGYYSSRGVHSYKPKMEIDNAIKESDNRRLKIKYNNAIYIIQRALALYSVEEVALSFNGGKDSTVLLHLLRAGYYLHMAEKNLSFEDLRDAETTFPIRTIYFESPTVFPEINSFTYETASIYKLQMDIIRLDFKSGLEALMKDKPIRAIFLGVRIGDPTAVGQEQFSPSSPGWPPFMRVNPILDWSYRDVWTFLLTCKVSYCSLYDQGYTSIGSIHDTVPNALLCLSKSSSSEDKYKPAYLLSDGRLERSGRAKKFISQPSSAVNGLKNEDFLVKSTFTASVIAVGDEILFGTVEDQMRSVLCRKLASIGWAVSHVAVTRNDIDSVADEVEREKSMTDMVFIYGGVGPLPSDVTVAGVAKAFGVRLAPDEEFEEYLRRLIGDKYTGDRNEMAQLPEGITELLHHDKLSLPLPLIKCQNVMILTATNVEELGQEWDCLIELMRSNGSLLVTGSFVSKRLATTLSDVETAQPLSEIYMEFPDLVIGGYRESRRGPVVIALKGKDEGRISAATEALCKKFSHGAFSEID
ncbi:phosphoadenosine phosphosulfate reductase family protein [Perilla frutescens var. frutescens]|nr:phosphoadenosine phosphosulfate reductase family protein [Perilla frutescens var. frutescens]